MDEKKKLVSRRDFLVAGGAVIAAGTLSACTPKAATETVTNTITNTKTVTNAVTATSTGAATTAAPAEVTLSLYDPQGPSEVTQLFAARSGNTDLNGKTVGFINTGWNGDATIKYLADLLKQKYPTVKLIMPEDWNVHEGEDNKNDLIQKMKDFKPDYVIISNAG
jgi:TAT (twin-arginine translocation) pathway signal sequence